MLGGLGCSVYRIACVRKRLLTDGWWAGGGGGGTGVGWGGVDSVCRIMCVRQIRILDWHVRWDGECTCGVCVCVFSGGLIHGLGRIGGTVSQATSQKLAEQDITITIPARARHHNTRIMQSKCLTTSRLSVHQVTWDSEKECFTTFAKELSDFFAVRKNVYAEVQARDEEQGQGEGSGQSEAGRQGDNWRWTVEHVIYPAFRSLLMPPKSASEDTSVLQLANLPDLYKVFERCWGFPVRVLELCENRGGRPGLPYLIRLRFLWT